MRSLLALANVVILASLAPPNPSQRLPSAAPWGVPVTEVGYQLELGWAQDRADRRIVRHDTDKPEH
jgi:hypothetical protein